jgi:hypothetical protein
MIMRLSYTTIFLAIGISGTIKASDADIQNLIPVPNYTSTTYTYHTDGFEPVRFRKRGADDIPVSLWEFDISNPSDFCYGSTDKVVLWRPDAGKKGEKLQMIKVSSDQEHFVTWPTKKHTMAWPSSISLVAGEYLIGIGDAINMVNLHKIPNTEANVQKWMEEQGCTQQVETLKEMRINLHPTTGI